MQFKKESPVWHFWNKRATCYQMEQNELFPGGKQKFEALRGRNRHWCQWESLWQQIIYSQAQKSQCDLCLTGRLILLTRLHSFFKVPHKADFSLFSLWQNSSLSQACERQPTQPSSEHLLTFSVNIWWYVFFFSVHPLALVLKVCRIQTGKWIL